MEYQNIRNTKYITRFENFNVEYMIDKNNLYFQYIGNMYMEDNRIIDFNYFKSLEENKKLYFFEDRLEMKDINKIIQEINKIIKLKENIGGF